MAGAVLESKVRIPRMHSGVPRNDLLARMAADADRGVRVTVVTAAAGWGKTTLLLQRAEVLESLHAPVAWLAADRDDTDARTLWSQILAACARAVDGYDARIGEALPHLPPAGVPDADFSDAMARALEPLGQDLWLVIDDIHEIAEPASLDALLRPAAGTPLRLLLASRNRPAMPLLQMVHDGAATLIGPADLALGRTETRRLLARRGVDLLEGDVDVLLTKTEGWPAGLGLAARALERRDDVSAQAFSGDHGPVADYLASEVLAGLPANVVDFLRTTSVPGRLTAGLANELTGRTDSAALLVLLARRNLAAVTHDDSAPAYRYHPLVRDCLTAEFDRRDAAAHHDAHRTASDWFDRHGHPEDAIHHACRAQDPERVAALTDRHGLRVLLEGGVTIAAMFDTAPATARAEPIVALIAAIGALLRGESADAASALDAVGRDPSVHEESRLRVLHATALLYEARLRGDEADQVVRLIGATKAWAGGDRHLELLATAARGMALVGIGDYANADTELFEAFDLAGRLGSDLLALDCLGHLAMSAAGASDFRAMSGRAAHAVDFAAERGWERSAPMVPVCLTAAWGAWQTMNLDTTEHYLGRAAGIGLDIDPRLRIGAEILQAHARFARTNDAARLQSRLRSVWANHDTSRLSPREVGAFCRMDLVVALSRRRDGWVTEIIDRARERLGAAGDVHVLVAMREMHNGNNGAARKALTPVRTGRSTCHTVNALVTGLLLDAHLAAADGERMLARGALRQAIGVAAPCWSLRPAVEAVSGRIAELLRADDFGEFNGFVREVLAARDRTAGGLVALFPGDALTARELELLRDLPSLLSLSEIAEAHMVSPNTVKSHLRSLYRKLRVNDRRSAVERGQEQGLV